MKKFRKFFEPCAEGTKGWNEHPDTRTLTVPDVVPSLKEIILSGSATQVGALLYDDSEAEGVKRLFALGAPLEVILNAQLEGFPPEAEETKETKSTTTTETEEGAE